ncbi:MAG: DUF899 family protein [Gaiellaceae bacterium]
MEPLAALSERVLLALVGAGDVAVQGHRDLESEVAHVASSWGSQVRPCLPGELIGPFETDTRPARYQDLSTHGRLPRKHACSVLGRAGFFSPAYSQPHSASLSRAGTDVVGYVTEGPGLSAYALEDGTVYRTYVTTARGLEPAMAYYALLDRTPKGRDESDTRPLWVRRHDEYGTS